MVFPIKGASAKHIPFVIICLGFIALSCSSIRAEDGSGNQTPAQPLLTLAITSIEVQDAYKPPLRDPYIEHLLPVLPAVQVHKWIQTHVRVGGGLHRLRIVIQEASVTERPLPVKKGFLGFFTDDQSEIYEARFRVRAEVVAHEHNTVSAWVEAKAAHEKSVPESASVDVRKATWTEVTDAAMTSLDFELSRLIRLHFADYIIPQVR